MKITVEVPNFEIWGNNDETPTEFITELKQAVMDKISGDINRELKSRKLLLDQAYQELFRKLEKDFTAQLNEIAEKFEKDTQNYINGLKK